jgi:CubicO group peptidase (beta-lactamase class C family)
VSLVVDGMTVVDLWGGFVDEARQVAWERDTLVNAYSVGKGLLAILALHCVENGELDLDTPVASIWPEFAAAGKGALSVRSLMAHRAGLPGVRRLLPDEAMYDWSLMCAELAAQAPFWEPDTAHGYHVNTYGYLVGEVLRRATGIPVGRLMHERLTGPLGIDYHYGLPASEHARVSRAFVPEARLTEPEQWAMAFPATGDEERDTMVWRTYFNPAGISGLGSVNTPAWREAVIPSTNGHGNARSVAALYQLHLTGGRDGIRCAGATLRSEATSTHSEGEDRILGRPSRFGLGFQLPQESRPLGPSPTAYGHFGYGGTLGLADSDAGLAFGFVTNRPGDRWNTPRTVRLLDAVYDSL